MISVRVIPEIGSQIIHQSLGSYFHPSAGWYPLPGSCTATSHKLPG